MISLDSKLQAKDSDPRMKLHCNVLKMKLIKIVILKKEKKCQKIEIKR